jgi:hypothetical protein
VLLLGAGAARLLLALLPVPTLLLLPLLLCLRLRLPALLPLLLVSVTAGARTLACRQRQERAQQAAGLCDRAASVQALECCGKQQLTVGAVVLQAGVRLQPTACTTVMCRWRPGGLGRTAMRGAVKALWGRSPGSAPPRRHPPGSSVTRPLVLGPGVAGASPGGCRRRTAPSTAA